MVQNPIIAIDGFASTGKSTVARALSQHFRLPFIDSGAFYRGITLFAIENGFVKNNKVDQGGLEPKLTELDFKYDSSSSHLYLNSQDISEKIRQPEIAQHVSSISSIDFVRDFVLKELRALGTDGLVMDGRDIGTVVFPHADYKFFFIAKPEVRAQRRYQELKVKGVVTSYQEVLNNLIHRDKTDSGREVAPLVKAEDAIEIDTSELNAQEVLSSAVQIIESK